MSKLELLCKIVDKKFNQECTEQQIKETSQKIKLSVNEFVNFQNIKSIAQIKGIISLEDSLFIYNALGYWDKQTLGTKICLTKLYADLLRAEIQGKL